MAFNPTVNVLVPIRNMRSKFSYKHKRIFITNETRASAQASIEENIRNREY